MAHDVFISHSSKDKPAADAVCTLLETDGLRCWIAPRDVQAGVSYAGAIIDAINECRAMVLIFSDAANGSPQIEREIERAANRRIPILPFRIEDVTPERGLEYFLSTPHWLDAFTPPLEAHIRELARQLHALLDERPAAGAAVVASPAPSPSLAAAVSPPPVGARAKRRMATGTMVAIGAVLVGGALAVAGGAAVWLGGQHPAHAPPPAPSSAAVSAASALPASSASAEPASNGAEAASSAAAEAVTALPSAGGVANVGGSRVGVAGPPRPGVRGARVGAVRPPIVGPRLAMRRPLPPLRRRPPPMRRRPFV